MVNPQQTFYTFSPLEVSIDFENSSGTALEFLSFMVAQLPNKLDEALASSEPRRERRRVNREESDFSLEVRAGRIAQARFKDKMPDNFEEQEFDDLALKEAVRGVLEKIRLNEVQSLLVDQEQKRLSGFVDREWGEARADLQESGLYNFDTPPQQGPRNKPAPTIEKAKAQLLAKLTPAQMEVVNQMKNPVFQMKPKRKKDGYITALNSKKPMPNQIDASVSPKMHEMWNDRDAQDGLTNPDEDNEIVGWQVGFIEGADAPDLLLGDDIKKTLGERCEWFAEEYGSKGVQGADFRSDALLQIRGLRKTPPRPVDDVWGKDKTWTMLNGEPIKDSLVAGADWYNFQVNFRGGHTDTQDRDARFRASVMVDVD